MLLVPVLCGLCGHPDVHDVVGSLITIDDVGVAAASMLVVGIVAASG